MTLLLRVLRYIDGGDPFESPPHCDAALGVRACGSALVLERVAPLSGPPAGEGPRWGIDHAWLLTDEAGELLGVV